MATVAQILDKYLKIFDHTTDIYKSLVSNIDGIPEITISDPIDYNIGVIADVLEWNRNLAKSLLNQLFLDLATGKFLNEICHVHIGIVRYDGESDVDYIERVQSFLINPKISPASIIAATSLYSSPGAPEILEGDFDTAFSDVTYADNYVTFQNQTPGDEFDHYILPAIPDRSNIAAFYFVLKLQNTATADIPKVVDIVERWIAAGIDYSIEIEET